MVCDVTVGDFWRKGMCIIDGTTSVSDLAMDSVVRCCVVWTYVVVIARRMCCCCRGCRDNEPVYQVVDLDQLVNLTATLNVDVSAHALSLISVCCH